MFGAWTNESSLPRTWWWGERGLVAALFRDLGAQQSLERWSRFLDLITFGNQARPFGVVRHAHVVVEPSFGSRGFGRPDAVALLEFEAQHRFAVFFEAKLGAYAEASKSPLGRSADGFNSSINGQLELNHRLALALERWNSPAVLREEQWITGMPYAVTKIRAVKDRAVLNVLLTPVARLPRTNYLHVILTADSSNPFADPTIAAYMPETFTPDATENQWSTEKKRFGWVGWGQVLTLAQQWRTDRESCSFLDTWAFLAAKLPVDDPAVSVRRVAATPGWTATRPARGVSLIFASKINPNTYLHFSWRQESCAVRDYSRSTTALPEADRSLETHQVLALIEDELPTTIERPQYTDVTGWNQRITDANRSRRQ